MEEPRTLLERYLSGVEFPALGGFEVLELLRTRSSLAAREAELSDAEQDRLADGDEMFLRQAPHFHDGLAALGDLEDLRCRENVPDLHWWWYLERLV